MQLQEGLEGFCLRLFTKIFGWNTSDICVMLAHVRKDIKDKSIHSQFDLFVNPLVSILAFLQNH